MASTRTVPEIAFVRVLTSGGPYRAGDILSVAFVSSDVGRLAAHDSTARDVSRDLEDLVPETISASVVRAAGRYSTGASVTLSFVDPEIARIHETSSGSHESGGSYDVQTLRDTVESHGQTRVIERPIALPIDARTNSQEDAPIIDSARAAGRTSGIRNREPSRRGARIRLDWNRDRVRRFVQVVDKLFAVDRLGWYRHAFAMRLLVPDVVICGDSPTDVEALRHLHALRAASIETLGRPLLAAFMPNFSVSAEWLDSLDKPAAARALAGLREALLPFAGDDTIDAAECETGWTIASIQKREIDEAPLSSVEALLPLFIPYTSALPDLTEKLTAYRATLIDIFGRTTQPADAVRLSAMSEPNRALDDRLMQLSHAVSEAFGGLVVA